METVLITGIGRGIGLHLAKEFASNGFNVIGTVRSDAAVERVSKMAISLKSKIETHILELTDFEAVESFGNSLKNRQIDILINCAGVIGGQHQNYDNLNFEEWEKTLRINTLSPMKVTLSVLPNLLLGKKSKVINISSIMGSLARERTDSIAYRSSKSALNKSMQCLSLELKSKNVGVYQMHPGWVRTEMGGPEADISVEESANGLFTAICSFGMKESGRFWQYDGTELEW